MISITLPWPPKSLSPNSRKHWAVKAKDAKHARQVAAWSVRSAGIRPGDLDIPYRVKVTLGFAPPDKRHRDDDNMLSSCKNFIDGIADAIGIDDSKFEIVIRRDVPVKGGAVHVTLEPA
ncbi:MAG: endodeoxyribonuclease RusA [Hyphomicrobiales bacterium]|nr:MAG: endodeoxyribonuclease RusA [Hyphomicrobiales bacterium]